MNDEEFTRGENRKLFAESVAITQLAEIIETQKAHGRALAFILAAMTKQPAQIANMPALLDELGREMPSNIIISASGLVGS